MDNIIPPEPPTIEPVIIPEPQVQEQQEQPKIDHKYRVVRAEGDPVFLIDSDNKRHWILNSKTYKALGYNFGEEQRITQAELQTYIPGEEITSDNYTKYL